MEDARKKTAAATDAPPISRRLFLGKETPYGLTVPLVEIGAYKKQDTQAHKGDDAVYLLQGEDIVDKHLDDGSLLPIESRA